MDILQNYSYHFSVILSKKSEKKKFEKKLKKQKQFKKKWNKKNSILIDYRILNWQIVYLFLLQKIKSLKNLFIFNSWWLRILIFFPFNKIHLKTNLITLKFYINIILYILVSGILEYLKRIKYILILFIYFYFWVIGKLRDQQKCQNKIFRTKTKTFFN